MHKYNLRIKDAICKGYNNKKFFHCLIFNIGWNDVTQMRKLWNIKTRMYKVSRSVSLLHWEDIYWICPALSIIISIFVAYFCISIIYFYIY